MAERNNVIQEIQTLIQTFENQYREGVDFRFSGLRSGEKWWNEIGIGCISILSPRLEKFCRERFNFPQGVNDYLMYEKMDEKGNHFFYQAGKKTKFLSFADNENCGELNFPHKDTKVGCRVCGNLTSEKDGRINLWESESPTEYRPKIIACFHPTCAKKYFTDKEQPNQSNNSQIKEKLLRNLDKLCLDPNGYLANNEYLKTDGAEEEYNKSYNSNLKSWKNRYLKIIIEGEEIDLERWDNSCPEYYKVKRELIGKIKSEIKQNSSEWKIKKGENENYAVKSNNRLIKHVSGCRHWKIAIDRLWGYGGSNEVGKYWTEIEALINGSKLPIDNKEPNNFELENLKEIFKEHNIKKITFENDKLTIEFNNQQLTSKINNQEYWILEKYCQKHHKKEITQEKLGINRNLTNTSNSGLEGKYLWLVGGISFGTIILLFILYGWRKKAKIK